MLAKAFALFLITFCVNQAKARDDERCRCVCPPFANVFNSSVLQLTQPSGVNASVVNTDHQTRTVYIKKDITSDDCKCENVLNSRMPNGSDFNMLNSFCLRCQCKFEKRNTATQKGIIIFLVFVMAMLFVYALFLVGIEPLFQRLLKSQRHRRAPTFLDNANYEGPVDDRAAVYSPADAEEEANYLLKPEEDRAAAAAAAASAPGVMNTLVNRVRQTQEKWKEDVHEQRQNIFTRHNLLN